MGYEIIAIDEASFHLTTTYKRIWFPTGETPRGAFFWSSKKLITFGALTSDHKFFYDFYSPPIQMRGLAKEDPQLNWLEKPIGFSQANN